MKAAGTNLLNEELAGLNGDDRLQAIQKLGHEAAARFFSTLSPESETHAGMAQYGNPAIQNAFEWE